MMKRLLVLLALLSVSMPANSVIFIRRGGGLGQAPIYNYVDLTTKTNVTFWWNGENCTVGTDCPADGSVTTYDLDEGTGTDGPEYSVADDTTPDNGDETNDPDFVNTGGGWTPLIAGSTQGMDVDGGSGRAELLSFANVQGELTGEAVNANSDMTGCVLIVGAHDRTSGTNIYTGTTPGSLDFYLQDTLNNLEFVFQGGDASVTLSWSTGSGYVNDTAYAIELSYILGTGNDTFKLRTDGTERASSTATDVGTWNIAGGTDWRIGTASGTGDARVDLVVIRSCKATGCDCDSDSLYDDIAGLCSEDGTTKCMTDADCTGTCG